MARTLLRLLVASCLSGQALSSTLRSRLAARQLAQDANDELTALGDADMVEAERAIGAQMQGDRRSFGTGAVSARPKRAAPAAAASTVDAAAAAAAPSAGEAFEQSIGTGFNNAMRSAGEYIRTEVSKGVKQAMGTMGMALGAEEGKEGKELGKKDLAFVHVPVNFGQAVERMGLSGDREQEFSLLYQSSFEAKKEHNQWNAIKMARGPGGEIWGQMNPELRALSNVTGCNLYHTPQKFWPEDIAERYFAGRRAFGLLRDPYDKVVTEFRQLATGGGEHSVESSRSDISVREGTTEREGQEYLDFYASCDINGWVKAELTRMRQGDVYRGNCHLVPQTEYFQHPHGISLAIDARLIPESFNEAMEDHGYPIRMDASTVKTNWKCDKMSAWSLDEESRALIREIYAGDFDLLCKTFGYCDSEEMTCMQQFRGMCGGSPHDMQAGPLMGRRATMGSD